MTFLAPVAAEVGAKTLWKVAPWAVAALLAVGLGSALWVQTARLTSTQVQLEESKKARNLADQDAHRWKNAADQRDGIIADQAKQLTEMKADRDAAQIIAEQTEAQRLQQVTDLEKSLAAVKEKARANPDQVRPYGPIASDVIDRMCRATGPVTADTPCD